MFFVKDADRVRRDSIINKEVPKVELEPDFATVDLAQEAKIEVAKPGLVSEVADNQNKQTYVKNDFGIRAEALYDYQAGSLYIKLNL